MGGWGEGREVMHIRGGCYIRGGGGGGGGGGGAIIGPSNNPVRRESGGRQTSLTGIGTVESFLHDIVPILIPQHIQENAAQKKCFTTVIIRIKLCSQEAIFICCQYYYTCLVNLNVAT